MSQKEHSINDTVIEEYLKKMNNSDYKTIHVLGLGGTILSKGDYAISKFYNLDSLEISELTNSLTFEHEKLNIVSEQFLNKISQDISNEELLKLAAKLNEIANNKSIDGIVVVQGTNSIEETAFFINLVVKKNKPIVFTGSFYPFSDLGYDGLRNLFNAVTVAASKKFNEFGVLLTFNDRIISANDAVKLNANTSNSFAMEDSVLGFVYGETIQTRNKWLKKYEIPYFLINNIQSLPKVCIIYGHQGMDDLFVKTAINNKYKGIVSVGFGEGYQSKTVSHALIEASNQGIIIARCSRTVFGTVNRNPKLEDKHNMVACNSLNAQKSAILLSLSLTKTDNKNEIQSFFDMY